MFSHQHHVNLKRISMDDGKGDLLSGSIRNLRHVSCLDHAITPTFERLGLTSCHFTLPCQAEVLQRENSRLPLSFNYRTRVRSLFTLVTNSLTHWLTHSYLVNLIDVILACEDANSKLVDVVTVADEDRVGNNLLLRFGQAFEFEVQARLAAGVWPVFSADVLKRLWRWILVEILKPGLVNILKLVYRFEDQHLLVGKDFLGCLLKFRLRSIQKELGVHNSRVEPCHIRVSHWNCQKWTKW